MLISSEVRHRLNHSSANPEDSTVSIWKSQWETLKKQKPVTLRLGNVHSVEEWCLQWFAVYFLKWWFHPFKIDCESAKLWIVKRGEGLLKMFAKRVNQLPSFKISCKPSPVFFFGLPEPTRKVHFSPVRCCDLSADERLLLTSSDDKTVKLSSVKERRFMASYLGHANWVRSAYLVGVYPAEV